MFKELAPYLRQRAVLLTVTHLDEDQIRVNVIPQKLKDGENSALTTPLSVTGTAEELDRDLPTTIVDFVSSHMKLKNSLGKAKEEMDAAAKAAQAEARAKSKSVQKKEPVKPDADKTAAAQKQPEPAKVDPPKTASLFDLPEPPSVEPILATPTQPDVEADILAEVAANEAGEDEELDQAA